MYVYVSEACKDKLLESVYSESTGSTDAYPMDAVLHGYRKQGVGRSKTDAVVGISPGLCYIALQTKCQSLYLRF